VSRAAQDDDQRSTDTIAIIEYRQRRNHAAYYSQRKQTLKRLRCPKTAERLEVSASYELSL